MSAETQNNSSLLLKIKLEELGITTLLNTYHDIQEDYIRNTNSGFRQQAQVDLGKMSEVNSKLKSLLQKTKQNLSDSYKQGIRDQQQVITNNPELVALSQRLNEDEKEIIEARNNFKNIDSEEANSALSRRSNYYKYMVMLILTIVSVSLTIRAFSSEDTNAIETVILMLAIGLIAYHIIEKIYGNVTRT